MPARIKIDGAVARLTGIHAPAAFLRECLSWLHPGRFFNRAFRDGRWDGKVCLADGNTFPAGFAPRVRRYLKRQGVSVAISSRDSAPVPDDDLDENYLAGIKLRDYQLAAVRAMLSRPRGALKEPTGSGKTAMIAAAARIFWEQMGWRSLIIVPRKGLAGQTRAALQKLYSGDVKVGIAGDGHRKGGPIVVATAQTMVHFKDRVVTKKKRKHKIEGDPWLRELLEQTDVLFLDECHRTKSDQWQAIASACPAARRYGLSGTPLREVEFNDIKLEGQTGAIIHETKAEELIDRKLAARPKIAMVMASETSEPIAKIPVVSRDGKTSMRDPKYRAAYDAAIVDSDRHNNAVLACVQWLHRRKRRILVLCRLKKHFARLAEGIQDLGIEVACLWGNTHTAERDEAKQMFADREINVILATTIFDEGEDVRGIDAIVLAEGVSTNTSALQRIGRGMRPDSEDVWVVDFVPLGSSVLTEHAARRADIYEGEGYEVEVVESWPKRLDASRPPKDLLPFASWT